MSLKSRSEGESKAAHIYALAYGQNPKTAELYEFIKTMEKYRNTIGKQSNLVLSINSNLF